MSRFRLPRYSFLVLALMCSCNHVSDDSITTDIKAKMFSEPLLKSATVNVTSKDGIVTITGLVPDDAARLAAEQIASKTKGVRQVIDSTTMAPPPPQGTETFTPSPPEPTPPPPKPAHKREQPHPAATAATPAAAPDNASASATPPAPQALVPATPAAASAPAPLAAPPPPPPPQPITLTIPEGAVVNVRTIDAIDSNTSSTGQFFQASLDAPVMVGDQVVLPKGLNAKLKLVQASSSGKFSGSSELTVSLDSVTYQGKTYTFATSDVQQKGASRGKRSAEVIGGGAVLGAIIGGLAGGGRGAAIGAGVGGAGGTAVQATTHGQHVKIPSETRLDFTLHAPVDVTFLPKKTARTAPTPVPDQSQPATQP